MELTSGKESHTPSTTVGATLPDTPESFPAGTVGVDMETFTPPTCRCTKRIHINTDRRSRKTDSAVSWECGGSVGRRGVATRFPKSNPPPPSSLPMLTLPLRHISERTAGYVTDVALSSDDAASESATSRQQQCHRGVSRSPRWVFGEISRKKVLQLGVSSPFATAVFRLSAGCARSP